MKDKNKNLFFEVSLNWIEKKKGLLASSDTEGVLHVGTPPAFGGEGKPWTPEHLFLGSLSSCFMTTFLAFADKADLPILHFACPVIGQIGIKGGKYRFLSIDLYPRIILEQDSLKEKALKVLEKTHEYCIISNSISAPVYYHSEVLTEELPVAMISCNDVNPSVAEA